MASNLDLCFPSSWDYRWEPLYLAPNCHLLNKPGVSPPLLESITKQPRSELHICETSMWFVKFKPISDDPLTRSCRPNMALIHRTVKIFLVTHHFLRENFIGKVRIFLIFQRVFGRSGYMKFICIPTW
jgi:hypothetical protein